jgi:hypothetical protein
MAGVTTATAGAAVSPSERQAVYAAKWRREHLFFTILPIVMFAVVVVGFAPTYYLKSLYGTPELRWMYHAHGLAFTSWMLLLIIQPALVLTRRTPAHRQVGWIAAVLVPVMTVLATVVSIDMARRGAAPPGVPPLVFMTVPMATVVVFPAFVAAALYWRRSPDTHKRLMLIATLELIPAGIARWPGVLPLGPLVFFGAADAFVLAIAAHDVMTRGRVHRATIWGGVLLVASQIGRLMLGATPAWESFAKWVIS